MLMEGSLQFFLFGDYNGASDRELRKLAHVNSDPVLGGYLNQAIHAIRDEVSKDTGLRGSPSASFSDLSDLLALRESGHRHFALDEAIGYIYHIAAFIRHVGLCGGAYPTGSNTFTVGTSAGSLAAATVSHCRSLTELLPAAVLGARLAFRAGVRARETANSIEPDSQLIGYWSFMVRCSAKTATETICRFNREKPLPVPSQPYLSACLPDSCIISGPPSTLRLISGYFEHEDINISPVEVHAPTHAKHLYQLAWLESLLSCISELSSLLPVFPVISSYDGQLLRTKDLRTALRDALSNRYIHTINWLPISERIAYAANSVPCSRPALHMFGSVTDEFVSQQLLDQMHAVTLNGCDRRSAGMPAFQSHFAIDCASTTMDNKPKLAVVGMSGRFPGANSTSRFWDNLLHGRDMCSMAPSSRWDAKTHVDITGKGKNTSMTGYGCWLEEADLFDASFFNISPREAPQIDPAQRIALMTAYEAIEQAGVVPGATPSTQKHRVGVFYGVTSNDWMETNSAQQIDTYFIPGGNRAFIPGRINYFFKFSGPSYSIDTACSSSLAAIHIACNALWQKDVDTAIAGGTNVITNPDFTAGLDRGHFLSRTGNCKTFDDTADGYCRGEGVGTVVIKRLDDALAENDPILGIVCDTGTNHNAEAQSLTRPCVDAQKKLFQRIIANTNTDVRSVDYVEMHGTGTQSGDAGEMQSVLETFAPRSLAARRDHTLYLGAAKANIGHGEAAAGISSLIKVLLMLKNESIPPHCGIKTRMNHKFPNDFDARNVAIPREKTAWPKTKGRKRKVFLNNFSAAGGNSSLLIEEFPEIKHKATEDLRSSHVIALSARSSTALQRNMEALKSHLNESISGGVSLPSLSYTTTARRMHHHYRVAVTGSSLSEVTAALQDALDSKRSSNRSKLRLKYLFAFTGQGSQYAGMANGSMEHRASFRSCVERLDRLSVLQGFPSVLEFLCEQSGDQPCTDPVVVQLGLVIFEMALFQLWKDWGISPDAVIGHSLGHYSALNAASVLTDTDTIFLVGRRAQLVRDLCESGKYSMLAVRSTRERIESILANSKCEIACINGPEDIVLGGRLNDLETLQAALTSRGLKCRSVNNRYAFHTSQMDPLLSEFEAIASQVIFKKPTKPVLCPMTSQVITTDGVIGPKYLADHCRYEVNMVDVLRLAKAEHVVSDDAITLEVGPHPVVSGMIRSVLGQQMRAFASAQRDVDPWRVTARNLAELYQAGASIDWIEYHRDFPMSHQVLSLPAYSWDLQSYWIQYRNDWSLRKGDPACTCSASQQASLQTTTVHKVLEEKVDASSGVMITEADLARIDLKKFVQGHRVNGISLCTPSIYADVAMSVARYLIDRYMPGKSGYGVDIRDMQLTRALIAHDQGSQLLRARFDIDWASDTIQCRFSSLNDPESKEINHATCTIRLIRSGNERDLLQKRAVPVKSRIVELGNRIATGQTFRFKNSMIYKMVAEVARFDREYQALEEIVLDNDGYEAYGNVTYHNKEDDGNFAVHPALMDALSQVGGFIMNANENTDLGEEVFVNHGWKGFQTFQNLHTGMKYVSHVRMEPRPDRVWEGDVLVLDNNDTVVARFDGLTLQGVNKRALHYILSRDSQRTNISAKSAPIRDVEPLLPAFNSTKPQAQSNQQLNPVEKDDLHSCSTNGVDKQVSTVNIASKAGETGVDGSASPKIVDKAMKIIEDESGISLNKLTDDSSFADMGIDSLLVLILVGRFNEELDVEVPSSLFFGGTVKDLKSYFDPSVQPNEDDRDTESTRASSIYDRSTVSEPATSDTEADYSDCGEACQKLSVSATSVILQGNAQTSEKMLILFPDGAGSASSYLHLSRLDPGVAVLGLNSPFLKDPSSMACYGFSTIMDAYIAEIRRRQPHGPYYLAGWSSGGILAYRAAQILLEQNEPVAHLTLIDSPAPLTGLDHLPTRWYERCIARKLTVASGSQANTLDEATQRTIAHFRANIELLHHYHAKPLAQNAEVAVDLIWAAEGTLSEVELKEFASDGQDSEGLRFLAEPKHGLSARDWDKLVCPSRINVETMEGVNHFTMMKEEGLTDLIRRTLR